MSFFKKLKNMVGGTGVMLDYAYVENPWPFFDPMIKATIRVRADKDEVTVLGYKATFYAKRTVGDNTEELVLGTDFVDVDNCFSEYVDDVRQKVLPRLVEAGGETTYGLFLKDMDASSELEKWSAGTPELAEKNGVTFFLKTEVDIKETVGLFDPVHEVEITVWDNFVERQKWLAEEREYEEQGRKEREADEAQDALDEVEDAKFQFSQSQIDFIKSDNHEVEAEHVIDGSPDEFHKLIPLNGKMVRLTDDWEGTTKVGLFTIEEVVGQRDLQFANPADWVNVSVDKMRYSLRTLDESGEVETLRQKSIYPIKEIALLKQ